MIWELALNAAVGMRRIFRISRRPVSCYVYLARVCVLFRGKKAAVCGKRLTFMYTMSMYTMSNKTFEVPRFSIFVFKKSSEKNIHYYIRGEEYKSFWSKTLAEHYFTIGLMYCVIRVVVFRGIKGHAHGSQSKLRTITQFCCNAGPASNTIDRH